jgi:hypothetical protein
MPNKDNIAGFEPVAQATVDLIEFKQTPDVVADAVLETLIEMSAETRISIWHRETGISVASLAALYSMYEHGAGFRRMRLYGEYEAGRLYRRRLRK